MRKARRGPRFWPIVFVGLVAWPLSGGRLATPGYAQPPDELLVRGRYVFALAGGCGCHTAEGGAVNAGGRPLTTPYGIFYGTNITPDTEHGIGTWTDQQIIDAIRRGVRPDGSVMSPVMPYPALSGISDMDVEALVAYLRSLPPVARTNQPHALSIPFAGLAMRAWRWLFFEPVQAPASSPQGGIERGAYISQHVAHCQECHSPRRWTGTLDPSRYMAGNPDGIDGKIAPNITPDVKTGIGDWSEDEIVTLLRSGFLPNFDTVQGLMALVIEGIPEGGYQDMSDADARAVAGYFKSIPAVEQVIGRERQGKETDG